MEEPIEIIAKIGQIGNGFILFGEGDEEGHFFGTIKELSKDLEDHFGENIEDIKERIFKKKEVKKNV